VHVREPKSVPRRQRLVESRNQDVVSLDARLDPALRGSGVDISQQLIFLGGMSSVQHPCTSPEVPPVANLRQYEGLHASVAQGRYTRHPFSPPEGFKARPGIPLRHLRQNCAMALLPRSKNLGRPRYVLRCEGSKLGAAGAFDQSGLDGVVRRPLYRSRKSRTTST